MPRIASQPSLAGGVHTGCSASLSLTVTEPDTAVSLRSGDVPVLGTPRLIALCEEATFVALAGRLDPGRTSVASRVQFDHLVPVRIGSTVTAEATLEKVEGRRLIFTITVELDTAERAALVAVGRLSRVVVDRTAFLAKAGCGGQTPAPPSGDPHDES